MNTDKLKKAALHYLQGLFATMWNAGWNGVAAILGIDGAALTGVSDKLQVLTAHQMIAAFLGGAIIHGIIWIKSHPIPEDFDTAPPMPISKP